MNPDDLRRADAIEVVVGQGAKPGGGGMLLGHKISDRVAAMRDLPKGIDQRSASRHPDWTGPDDLEIKILELREITDWEKPIFVKVGATRTYYDVQLAVKAGADVIVVDGMQGGTAATQDVFIEHVGIPTLPAVRLAVDALQELGMHREVQLIVSGGIRTGADVAKALALGADAVSIGTAALIALGDNAPEHEEAYRELGSAAGFYDDWQAGRDPAGHLDAGRRARRALRPGRRRPAARELPARADAGDADARARVRQVARPQPRAGGPRRADGRGGGDGARAARRARAGSPASTARTDAAARRRRGAVRRARRDRGRVLEQQRQRLARDRAAEARDRALHRDDRRRARRGSTRPARRSRSAPARAPRRPRPSRPCGSARARPRARPGR